MKRWEYKYWHEGDYNGSPLYVNQLNEWGKEGWKVVSAFAKEGSIHVILRRRKK